MKRLLLLLLPCCFGGSVVAQTERPIFTPKEGAILDGRTIIKTNLLGYPLKSYNASLERILTKRISLQVGYAERPADQLPFDLNKKLPKDLSKLTLGSQSLSVDLRFYLSRRGYGHGFYLQPYYRYEHHALGDIELAKKTEISISGTSSNASTGTGSSFEAKYEETLPFSIRGNMRSHSFGLSLGAQWLLGKKKNFLIDWTILGVHFSSRGKSYLNGIYRGETNNLTEELKDKEERKQAVKDFEDSLRDTIKEAKVIKEKDIHVKASEDFKKVDVTIAHPYLFLRSSLSIGIRF